MHKPKPQSARREEDLRVNAKKAKLSNSSKEKFVNLLFIAIRLLKRNRKR